MTIIHQNIELLQGNLHYGFGTNNETNAYLHTTAPVSTLGRAQ